MLASYYSGQVKVAEMPLDTCRMMQAIEWEDPAASAGPAAPTMALHRVLSPLVGFICTQPLGSTQLDCWQHMR